MERNDHITLGDYEGTFTRWQNIPLTLSPDARLRQTFVVGQTGTGKSTLLANMAISDMHAGNGFMLVDPHGDEARRVIDYVPKHRMRDVIYLDPSNKSDAFGFNVLHNPRDDEKDRLTQEVVNTFRYRWSESWGARMENIFKHSIRALLDIPSHEGGATLLMLPAFLARADYRAWVLRQSDTPAVQDFFQYEFENWNERQRHEFVQPIQNKVDAFLLSRSLRNVLGQPKSTIDLDYIMNNRKVLIINLAKGRIGKDDADTLGSLFATALQMAAMRRASCDEDTEEHRVPFYAYFDEFHSFTTGSFASILSESRKYGVGLFLAAQYLDQIEVPQVRSAIFGNVGNIICFRVGNDDAQFLAPTLERPSNDLEYLYTGEARVKVLQDGIPVTGHLTTLPIRHNIYVGRAKRVRRHSTHRYTTDVRIIEHYHHKWATALTNLEEQEKRSRRKKSAGRNNKQRRAAKVEKTK